jgi:hypothetical protein
MVSPETSARGLREDLNASHALSTRAKPVEQVLKLPMIIAVKAGSRSRRQGKWE